MKHSRPLDCCCCRWLTLLLVASSIIYVSPKSSTTATVKFNQHQQQQSQQPQQQRREAPFKYTTSSAATSMTYKNNNNDNNNKYDKNQSNYKDNNVTTTRIELTTIMMELTTEIATVAAATAAQIATKTTKLPTYSTTIVTTTTTARRSHPHTNTTTTTIAENNFTNEDIHNSNKLSKTKHKSNLQQELLLQYQQQQRQQPQQLVHDSMFFSKDHFKEIQKKLYYEKKQQQRYTRQADDKDEGIDKCRQFTVGDMEKKMLYSPDFPYNYTNKINCTRVLEAPEGQIVRLDFRDKFHIEGTEGECKFDFLEVRDGKYGFSKEIGTYCGTTFPPIITSKERYLWLHFQSDESIEYSGFTAVYEFLTRKQDTPSTDLNCTIYKGGHSGIANSTIDIGDDVREIVARNKIPLDCIFRIEVQENWKISISFKHFKLAKPNDCQANFLDIFPEETTMPLRIKNLCGSAGESVTSPSNVLNLHFYAEQDAINTTTFTVLYTAIRDKSTKCNDDEYDCADDTCIHESLKCDGDKNCKFSWDEEKCPTLEDDQPEHITIIMYVFGSILGGMILTYLVNCVRKIMRDQKIIREHVRQSKESKLDQLDRQSKARSQTNLSMPMSPRQKHSQTSLQILDDVSNRYYREVVPISVQTGGNGGGGKIDLKEKEHSILRHHHHHDMTVQTSLVLDDSSSTTTAATNEAPGGAGGAGNVCDMGCQTRESLFAPTLLRQKSISSMGVSGTLPPPPRFSTFGYDMQQPPPPPPPAVSTIARHNIRVPTESIELEERPHQQQQQQHVGATTTHHQHQHQGSAGSGTMRPQEMCHHHHQHQQHLQQQQQQLQQQRQQKYQQQQQQYAPTTTASGQQTLQRATQKQQQQQQQQQQQPKQHQSTATIIPSTFLPISTPTSAAAGATTTGWIGSKNNSKHQKVDGSNAYSDIRNSAPDVIIMTSH